MVKVPEYGIHDGIKYNKKRCLVRWCIICGSPFHPTGRRDKVCGDECRESKNKEHNNKWNPINNPINNWKNNYKNNAKKGKQVLTPEQKRRNNANWKKWYNNLHPDQRKKYNDKKKKGKKKKYGEDGYEPQVEDYAALQEEMKSLGLR